MTRKIEILPVDRQRWPDLESLFESGSWSRLCWCMVWRAQGEEARSTDRRSRKIAMESRVKSGTPVGLLAYMENLPVAWCSVAPRSTHRALGGPDDYGDDDNAVWSLTCFLVAKEHRREGLSDVLIAAAIDHARAMGAKVLEAYPVNPDSPSYRYMGFVPQFEKHGFSKVGQAGKRRHVYRVIL
jgi:GNAT superfamily N-acetyltransferase